MNSRDISIIGPHAYQIQVESGVLRLQYCLFHANGRRGKPREGHPNEHGWRVHRRQWQATPEGKAALLTFVQSLLKPVSEGQMLVLRAACGDEMRRR